MTEPTEEQRAAATAILNNTELAEAIAANRGRDAAKKLAAQWGFRLAEAEEQRDSALADARREAIEECARIADRRGDVGDEIRALLNPKPEEMRDV